MTLKEILAVRATKGHGRWYPGKQKEIEAGTASQGWGKTLYLSSSGAYRPVEERTAGKAVSIPNQITGGGSVSSAFSFSAIPSVVWIILVVAGGIYLLKRIF